MVLFAALASNPYQCRAADEFPKDTVVDETKLLLNGVGIRKATIFGIQVYHAALYIAEPVRSAEKVLTAPRPLKLTLRFVRRVSGEELGAAWEEGFTKNNPDGAQMITELRALVGGMGDVREGDELSLLLTSKGITREGPHGQVQAIDDPRFATAVLRIWMGSAPPDVGLVQGMLGVKDDGR